MSARLLSLLSPTRGFRTEPPTSAWGALKPSDVAAALAGRVEDTAHWVVWAKYVSADQTTIEHLWDAIELCVLLWARVGRWQLQRIDGVVALAIQEFIYPHPCRGCQGCGRVVAINDWAECYECKGTGVRNYTAAERARIIGVSEREYGRKYLAPMNEIFARMTGMERYVVRQIGRRLG